MTTPRERRRPGAGAPFPLTPHVEPIVPSPPTEPSPAPSFAEPPTRQRDTHEPPPADTKVSRTFQLRTGTLATAQTAVLRTAGLEGGYPSLNALIEAAVVRELHRLADQFNGGAPFPPHAGKFRTGRPIGS